MPKHKMMRKVLPELSTALPYHVQSASLWHHNFVILTALFSCKIVFREEDSVLHSHMFQSDIHSCQSVRLTLWAQN